MRSLIFIFQFEEPVRVEGADRKTHIDEEDYLMRKIFKSNNTLLYLLYGTEYLHFETRPLLNGVVLFNKEVNEEYAKTLFGRKVLLFPCQDIQHSINTHKMNCDWREIDSRNHDMSM
jgi:hypothetical protein